MNSQPRNSNTKKYVGPVQQLLDFAGCMELSQITPEHLDRFASGAALALRSRLFGLWAGHHDPSPELQAVIAEVIGGR